MKINFLSRIACIERALIAFLISLLILTSAACSATQAAVPVDAISVHADTSSGQIELGDYQDVQSEQTMRPAEWRQRRQDYIDKIIPGQTPKQQAKNISQSASQIAENAKPSTKHTAKDTEKTLKRSTPNIQKSVKSTVKDANESAQQAAENVMQNTQEAFENLKANIQGAADKAANAL